MCSRSLLRPEHRMEYQAAVMTSGVTANCRFSVVEANLISNLSTSCSSDMSFAPYPTQRLVTESIRRLILFCQALRPSHPVC